MTLKMNRLFEPFPDNLLYCPGVEVDPYERLILDDGNNSWSELGYIFEWSVGANVYIIAQPKSRLSISQRACLNLDLFSLKLSIERKGIRFVQLNWFDPFPDPCVWLKGICRRIWCDEAADIWSSKCKTGLLWSSRRFRLCRQRPRTEHHLWCPSQCLLWNRNEPWKQLGDHKLPHRNAKYVQLIRIYSLIYQRIATFYCSGTLFWVGILVHFRDWISTQFSITGSKIWRNLASQIKYSHWYFEESIFYDNTSV